MQKHYSHLTAIAAGLFLFSACKKNDHIPQADLDKVKHVVVIYLENHSFDNLFGHYPGANGLNNASQSKMIQVDSNGNPYTFLPAITQSAAFPTNLPNKVFQIDQ